MWSEKRGVLKKSFGKIIINILTFVSTTTTPLIYYISLPKFIILSLTIKAKKKEEKKSKAREKEKQTSKTYKLWSKV